MRLRNRFSIVAVAATLMVAGCQEPKEIVMVAPPGVEFPKTPIPEGQGAQALGEQGAAQARSNKSTPTASPAGTPDGGPESPPTPIGKPVTTASGLIYETLKEGTGPVAKSGMNVKIHYTGTLLSNGSKFDSSRDRGDPFSFDHIGSGQVIKGWNEGVPGMKVGERRKLTIPPDLGYGSERKSTIPPNSTLVFDLELMEAH